MYLKYEVRVPVLRNRHHGQRKRLSTTTDIYNGSTRFIPNRMDQVYTVLAIIYGIISSEMVSAFALKVIKIHTWQIRSRQSSNICILRDQNNQDQDEIIQSAIPIQPQPPSQYVQQEQLLEVVSRIGADTIASLSISERTKRAMLAEAVEDEIFACTEQLIDLVKEQQENNVKDDGNQSELNQRQRTAAIEDKIRDLRERNHFLQGQYNDLVSGRSSSLLNTVNSVGDSTAMASAELNDAIGKESNIDNDDANYDQFN
jgi:hypothetical protein